MCTTLCAALLAGLFATWPKPAYSQTAPSKVRPPAISTASYADHDAAQAFARDLDARAGWSEPWAQRWLRVAERNPRVIQLMTPAPVGTPRDWRRYRDRLVEPRRIQAGLRFWQEHAATLNRAEAEFGVPAWLIVGIIGIETLYGQHMGRFRVLDALTTLAFDFPPEHPRAEQRAAFFKSELEALLRKSHASATAPTEWRGSFAGAIGLPQFMPSNWALYGVDYDGDGRIDLINSSADAIASVARYMQAFGWQAGMATHYPVELEPTWLDLEALLAPSILPTFTPAAMQALGARLNDAGQGHNGLLALVELQNGDPSQGGSPPTYVAGTANFYAITRYNQSSLYAMAVIELGQAVQTIQQHTGTQIVGPIR